jgi:hypothetical protein
MGSKNGVSKSTVRKSGLRRSKYIIFGGYRPGLEGIGLRPTASESSDRGVPPALVLMSQLPEICSCISEQRESNTEVQES